MVELDDNNPPQTFTFTRKEFLQKLAELDDGSVSDYNFAFWLSGLLGLQGQHDVVGKDGMMSVTLFNPSPEDVAKLQK